MIRNMYINNKYEEMSNFVNRNSNQFTSVETVYSSGISVVKVIFMLILSICNIQLSCPTGRAKTRLCNFLLVSLRPFILFRWALSYAFLQLNPFFDGMMLIITLERFKKAFFDVFTICRPKGNHASKSYSELTRGNWNETLKLVRLPWAMLEEQEWRLTWYHHEQN